MYDNKNGMGKCMIYNKGYCAYYNKVWSYCMWYEKGVYCRIYDKGIFGYV